MVEGFMVYSSARLTENEKIRLVRSTKASHKSKVVGIESNRNGTFARLNQSFATWIVNLIDLKLCEFDGNLLFPPPSARAGKFFFFLLFFTL